MSRFFRRLFFHIGNFFADPALTHDQRTLIAIVTLLFFGNGFSGTFVNTFLYSAGGNLKSVILYNIYNYCGVVVASMLIAVVGRRFTMKNCLILGMGFYVVVYVLLLYLREAAAGYVWLVGTLMALGSSFFYIPHHSLVYQRTDDRVRDLYFSRQGIFTTIGSLVAPFISGYAITAIGGTTGYLAMFSLSLLMFIVAGVIALRLERGRPVLSVRSFLFLTFRQAIKRTNYRDVLIASVLRGVREGTMWVLVGTLLFSMSDNFAVGIYNFVTSGLLIVSFYISQKQLRPDNRRSWLLLSTSLLAFSTLLFAIELSPLTIFTYGIITSLGMAFFNTPTASIYYHVASSLPASNRRSLEAMALQEMMLNIGRGISMVSLFFLPDSLLVLIVVMVVAGFLQFATWFFYARADKHTCLSMQKR